MAVLVSAGDVVVVGMLVGRVDVHVIVDVRVWNTRLGCEGHREGDGDLRTMLRRPRL